jgi:L-cysteine S-thiosulfotransferase
MRRASSLLLITAFLLLVTACEPGRHSSAGFRLPDDGSVDRGKAAFVDLGCNNCHSVSGVELAAPSDPRSVSIELGGEKAFEMNDGYLVTSIIHPSYKIAGYPKERVSAAGVSLMPSHAEHMTVQQMTDIVAFLQSHYSKKAMPSRYSY